ncbi:DEAD-domain-containing protein [Sistotremastrum suecicum HHB10207 ss-3]|uniref:ATP-dependent RNA helicase n=1 Tax=Sistotremastrum suecicum HHB10207 ss-3 TaxID=1314776 RepID=A0A166A8C4_9AGAM|nr:DEAD-domain-containing protein [Sistotremastrum suecicum HHB10207 ss-3]
MSTTAFAGSFASLKPPLTPWIEDVVKSCGFTQMTPVQASTIPLFMGSKDVVVEAVTGSGKTLAFVIPIIERLIRRTERLKSKQIGAIVISPTRELAEQIHAVFKLFLDSQPPPSHSSFFPSSDTDEDEEETTPPPPPAETEGEEPPEEKPTYPPPLLLISGPSSPSQDIQRFIKEESDIIVGTPGRIEEFLVGRGRGVVDCREVEVLVLDEADRLLDLGFEKSITKILGHLPKQRRTGLFSATMTDGLGELVRAGLRNPTRVVVRVEAKRRLPPPPSASASTSACASSSALTSTSTSTSESKKRKRDPQPIEEVTERRTPATLQNFYLTCHPSEKLIQLCRVIEYERRVMGSSKFVVYFSTCAGVAYFWGVLGAVLPHFLRSTSTSLPESSTSSTSSSNLPESSAADTSTSSKKKQKKQRQKNSTQSQNQNQPYTLHSLHGHLPPLTRSSTLSSFSSHPSTPSHPSILLTTDVAARGLDIPLVDVVVQFDLPVDPRGFMHRVGRGGRGGRDGRGWCFLVGEGEGGREEGYVDFLAVRKIPLQRRGYILADGTESPLPSSSHPSSSSAHPSSAQPGHKDEDVEMANLDGDPEEDGGGGGGGGGREEDPAVDWALREIRKWVLRDRDLHEKAMKAYVSHIRAYSKHEASYIFRLKDLDLIGVAKSFGLLRLPRMPEISALKAKAKAAAEAKPKTQTQAQERANEKETGQETGQERAKGLRGWVDADVDWDNFKFLDPKREAQRVLLLSQKAEEKKGMKESEERKERKERKKVNGAWSAKSEKKERREERREKKKRKRVALRAATANVNAANDATNDTGTDAEEGEGRVPSRRKSGDDGDDGSDDNHQDNHIGGNYSDGGDGGDGDVDDWEELKREEKMAKRVRMGRVSKSVFESSFGLDL